MYMFGHHHISTSRNCVAANFIQDFSQTGLALEPSQARVFYVATEGDKMKIALPVMPLERMAHRTKPAPLKRGAAPRLSPSAIKKCMLVQCAPVKKKKTSRATAHNRTNSDEPQIGGPLLVLWTGSTRIGRHGVHLATRGCTNEAKAIAIGSGISRAVCPVKNTKGALFIVAYFSVAVFVS